MKKKFLLSILSFLCLLSVSQTAVDFTASDCSGNSHNLFTELNAGKIVVLVWVMPCGTCISDAKAAYDAAQSFATSNPGRVLYWMIDDFGNSSCATVNSWANNNAIPLSKITVFGNSGNKIDENNFGGTGMPHVVVCGGMNHKIFINKKNGSNNGVAYSQAITQALANGIVSGNETERAITLFPNPAKTNITLSFPSNKFKYTQIEIYNILGVKVLELNQPATFNNGSAILIDLPPTLIKGNYLLKLKSDEENYSLRFTMVE